MKKFYQNLIIAVSLVAALSAHALDSSAPELVLSVKPVSPQSGESFTVEAKSYAFDPLRAHFNWTLNGKTISSGVGLSSINLTGSEIGSAMKVGITASIDNGRVFSNTITINIADVDIIANPLTYAPVLYRGSPLASPNSTVEVYAVPHLYSVGAIISDGNIVYEWSLNGQKTGSQSGPGKNKFVFSIPDAGGSRAKIKVKASNLSGSVSAEKSISIPPIAPQLLFYQTNPLTGRSALAGASFGVRGGENISVLSEPYFFSFVSLDKAVVAWTSNGEKFIQPAGRNPLLLEITAPQNAISLTNFSVNVRDKKSIWQTVTGSFNITASQ